MYLVTFKKVERDRDRHDIWYFRSNSILDSDIDY